MYSSPARGPTPVFVIQIFQKIIKIFDRIIQRGSRDPIILKTSITLHSIQYDEYNLPHDRIF